MLGTWPAHHPVDLSAGRPGAAPQVRHITRAELPAFLNDVNCHKLSGILQVLQAFDVKSLRC